MSTRWEEVLLGAQVADLKEAGLSYALALASLVEVLIAKGVLTAEELARKSDELDRASEPVAAPLAWSQRP